MPLGPVRGPIPAPVSLTRVTRDEGTVLLHMRGKLHRTADCLLCASEGLIFELRDLHGRELPDRYLNLTRRQA